MNIKILLTPNTGLSLPKYETEYSAGVDLMACIGNENIILAPNERKLIKTGIAIALPNGTEAQIRSRSGLALKYGIAVLNAPGTIDSDYRGEIGVILINLGNDNFEIKHGMRIAQMVVSPVGKANFIQVDKLSDTDRGSGGFGSTGV